MRPDAFLYPDWPAPAAVAAVQTTRAAGLDWQAGLTLPAEPAWLQQVHGTAVAQLDAPQADRPQADAAVTRHRGVVLAIRTADCLPVLFCDRDASVVAAAHAGWRGLAAGILERTVAATGCPPGRLLAWLGAAIGPRAFEVGPEVRARFVAADPAAAAAFEAGTGDRWFADLYRLARQRLAAAGVAAVHGGGLCTHADPARFFSYRRDGETGRMASLIWIGDADAR